MFMGLSSDLRGRFELGARMGEHRTSCSVSPDVEGFTELTPARSARDLHPLAIINPARSADQKMSAHSAGRLPRCSRSLADPLVQLRRPTKASDRCRATTSPRHRGRHAYNPARLSTRAAKSVSMLLD